MKFQHLLSNYSLGRRVVGHMPAFVELTAKDRTEPYTPATLRRLELRMYCDFTLHPMDDAGLAQQHAEAQLMRALYGKVQEAAWNIESRMFELGIYDEQLIRMVKDLQKVEV